MRTEKSPNQSHVTGATGVIESVPKKNTCWGITNHLLESPQKVSFGDDLPFTTRQAILLPSRSAPNSLAQWPGAQLGPGSRVLSSAPRSGGDGSVESRPSVGDPPTMPLLLVAMPFVT